MKNRVLVSYSTKYGATKEIAEKIGNVLRDAGLHVDVLSVEQVTDVSSYGAVVLGSAVYVGKWRREAAVFLEDFATELSEKPVWLFSSGPTGEGDPVELMKGWDFPEDLESLAEQIQPVDITVFHGNLNSERMSFVEKMLIKGIRAPVGDFRDWDSIEHWANEIVVALKPEFAQ